MSLFVLVHGAWGGGWQWRTVANTLRGHGHEVYTPTLTGLGERSHLTVAAGTTVGLAAHVQDVLQVFYFEDLTDVILVGWSYGGLVVDGVADLVPERLRAVVNLDGPVFEDGAAVFDIWPAFDRELGAVPPPTAADLGPDLGGATRPDWVGERLRPQPVIEDERYPASGGRRATLPHVYLRCTVDPFPEESQITTLRTHQGWVFRELPGSHWAILGAPQLISDALLYLLTTLPRST